MKRVDFWFMCYPRVQNVVFFFSLRELEMVLFSFSSLSFFFFFFWCGFGIVTIVLFVLTILSIRVSCG